MATKNNMSKEITIINNAPVVINADVDIVKNRYGENGEYESVLISLNAVDTNTNNTKCYLSIDQAQHIARALIEAVEKANALRNEQLD